MNKESRVTSQEIEIPCVGYSIKADWYEGDNDEVYLDLIGFTSSKSRYKDSTGFRVEKTGCSALVLDYSGHGESPFDIQDLTPAQNFLEVVTAYDWLVENYPDKQINVIGSSFGCYLAVNLLKYREVKDLILRAPALYEPDNFYTKWRDSDMEKRHEYRLAGVDLDKHPVFRGVGSITGRSLVVTHELDAICPAHSTKPFIDALNADAWEAKGFQHSISDGDVAKQQIEEYNQKIIEWINK